MSKLSALLLLSLAAPAAAQTGGTATLTAPTDQRGPMIANGFVWHCAAATCTGRAGGDRFGDEKTCKELAHQVGSVATFATGRGAMPAEDLARCNARARPAG